MTDIVIRVENLSKLYRISPRQPYRTLRDTLTDAIYAPFRRLRANSKFEIRNSKLTNPQSSIRNLIIPSGP